MLRKTFSCSELCTRWDINKNDLTGIVRDGKLKALNCTYSLVEIKDNAYFYKDNRSVGSGAVCTGGPLAVTDENGFYFLSSDVEAFERENGITSHIRPADALQPVLTKNPTGAHLHDKLPGKKPMPTLRVSFVYNEAKKLRHDCPEVDQVMARTRINILLEESGYRPYKRTQFNRIIGDLKFPPAPRGRKLANNKK